MLPSKAGFAKTRAENREFWDGIASTGKHAEGVLKGARKIAAGQVDKSNVRKCASEASNLALAECIENKGSYISAIEERLDAMAAKVSWTGAYHDKEGLAAKGKIAIIELNNGQLARDVAVTVDLLRSKLSPEVRARAIGAVRRICLNTYLGIARNTAVASANKCWWIDADSNWNAACNSYMVRTALMILDDPQERAEAIELAERSVKFFLGSYTKDGLCLEGASYWWYGFGEYMRLALRVRQATGSFLSFMPPFAKKAYLSSYGSLYGDFTGPSFGDCNIGDEYTRILHLGSLIWPEFDRFDSRHARFLIHPEEVALRGAEGEFDNVKAFLSKKLKPFDYPVRSWYPDDAAQLVARPAKNAGPGSISAAIKGGGNDRPHGHHDAGTYCIAIKGLEVMGDPGNTKYDNDTFTSKRYRNPMRNSFGHPVPRVAGMLQSGEKAARAEVLESSFSEERDVVSYDMKGVYRNVQNLASLVRTFDYNRAKGCVTVTDKVSFNAAERFETALITLGTVEELGGGTFRFTDNTGKVAAKCTVKVKGGKWHVEHETIPVVSRSKKLKKGSKPLRFAIVLDTPTANAEVSVLWESDVEEKGAK